MNTKAWIATVVSSMLLACSSTPNRGFANPGDGDAGSGGSSSGSSGDDGGGSSGGGSSGAGSSDASTSGGSSGGSGGGASSGSTSSGGSSGGAGYGGGTIPAADKGTAVTLTAMPFDVPAGAEYYKCQVFANPFGGVATDILSLHGTMSAGSHHFFLFNETSVEVAVEPPIGTIGDCAGKGLEFHPFPFLSQQPDWTVSYPIDSAGIPMGYPLLGANYVMINVHYLNTSSKTITANVKITITPAKAGVVKTHVGTIFLNQTQMSVPATATVQSPVHTTSTWGGDPNALPTSYSIFTSWSHMHKWGLKFTASTGSNTFYTETNWDSPNLYIHEPHVPEPPTATGPTSPIQMTASSPITWDCTYYNDTGATLMFGDSAQTAVMCMYLGQYYPANPSAPDEIVLQ